ncbi:TetR/AcrR family transcriptional regulator [Amycolatopsis sp. FDAARGOS 1241]|uniref:TetR/AcrR family transcriptional regulator n=1 Tax=Amycolatopsis sp. FDAARGOS 1241 TaxID=2778070 RepID=UPI00194E45B4|nr:TetR/AcrR family transcriptional regulator [Amycolatopsis sp. FDAARGOS 1241]QRP44690.1 TetR/AcrR family transcriptional regulator [Amycolatopsis sp. FDAARGOS 1241]
MPAVTREQYFEAALGVLSADGFAGLNVGRLCRELGVTSGSFYHHFGGWAAFVDELLAFWENRQVLILAAGDFGTAGPAADFAALMDLTLGLHHKAEAAIRAWSVNDETVRAAQKRVDHARLRTVGRAVKGIVSDAVPARTLTALGLAMLVGHQQLAAAGEDTDLPALIAEYTWLVHSRARRCRGPA